MRRDRERRDQALRRENYPATGLQLAVATLGGITVRGALHHWGEEEQVYISVLGPVEVHDGGDVIQLGPSLRRLLVALVVHRDTVIEPDRLVDLVWAGDPPSGAATTLRSHVIRLRAALGDAGDALAFRQSGYVLDVDDDALDAVCFDVDLDRAADALRVAEPDVALDAVDEALGRWHGRPFSGFDDEWVEAERARLQERHAEARELQIEAMIALGRTDAAVAAAQSLSHDLPLREHPRALLMRGLSSAGRQAEAVRAYRDYRAYLADETGLDPSPELAELEGRIVRGELRAQAEFGRVRGYALGPRLGQGAFSVVHSAVQPSVGRDVAVKIIRPQLADRPEFVRRFEHEAQLVASIEHPFVVPLYDFWREPGAAYLVMRLMRGGSVADLVRSQGAVSTTQVVRILDQVGGALEAAHRAGVVHGDIRPANLLRDDEGRTYLADFGIATPIDADQRRTIHYAAPETLRGTQPSATADVLSLGVTAFELLTGRLPYEDSDDRADLVRRILAEPLPPVRATRTDLSELVDDVLARATSKAHEDRYHDITEFVDELSHALQRDPTRRSTTPVANPYVGLHTFTEADAARFHGREQLVADVLEAAERLPVVTLVGPSGSGKSSVVRAGVLPAIRHGAIPGSSSWFVTTMLPGADPIDAFEAALLRVAVNAPTSLREQLSEPGGLLRSVRRVLPNDEATVLVVIDQFEELFTLVDDETQHRFLAELARAVVAPRSPLRIIATLRADHFDGPMRHVEMAELVTNGTVAMRPMRPDELERAIRMPAHGVGVEVEPALVAELVGRTADRPASLPFLQFALTEVFDRRVADVMLLESYHTIGGLTGALTARADRIVDDDDGPHEAAARRIFARLVTVGASADGDVRRRAPRSAFGDDERTTWLIDQFVAARLLVVDRDEMTRAPVLEIAHEALLRDWPRLRAWVDDDRDDLRLHRRITDGSTDWRAAGEDAGLLARGARLELATELLDRRPELMNESETAWIIRSGEAAEVEHAEALRRAETERRQHRRTRRLLVTTAALLAVAVAATIVALVLRGRAVDSERQADIDRLIAVSGRESFTVPDRGVLLALEADRRGANNATATAIHRALNIEPRLLTMRQVPYEHHWPSPISGDGRTGLAWGPRGDTEVAVFFATATGEPVGEVFELDSMDSAFISDDGSTGAIITDRGAVTFVNRDGSIRSTPQTPGGVISVDLDADGERAAATVTDGSSSLLVVVETETGDLLATHDLEVAPRDVMNEAIAPDGRSAAVAVAFFDGPDLHRVEAIVYETSAGRTLARFDVHPSWILDMTMANDGRIIVAYEDGAVGVHGSPDGTTGDALLRGHTQAAIAVDVNGRGDIVSFSDDGTLRLWPSGATTALRPIDWTPAAGTASVAIGDDRVMVISTIDRPIARFGESPESLRLARHDVDGLVSLRGQPDHFVEIDQDAGRYRIRSLETGEVVSEIEVADWEFGVGTRVFGSPDNQRLLAPDGRSHNWVMWSVDGASRFDFTTDQVYEALGLDARQRGTISLRPGRRGDRLWVLLSAAEGGARGAWLSVPELDLVAGPVDLAAAGPTWELPDGRLVIGASELSAMTVLAPDLEGNPIVVDDSDRLAVRAEDPTTGEIYVAGQGGRVGVADPNTWALRMFSPIDGFVSDLAVSPSAGVVAAATADGVQLIDIDSGRPLGTAAPADTFVFGGTAPTVKWNDEGTGVWWTAGGPPTLLSADPDHWREAACNMIDRDLSAVEWTTFVDPSTEPVSACNGSAAAD